MCKWWLLLLAASAAAAAAAGPVLMCASLCVCVYLNEYDIINFHHHHHHHLFYHLKGVKHTQAQDYQTITINIIIIA